MSVKIKRDTGWIGKFGPLKVTLNGEKITEIYNEEITDIGLPEERMILGISQFGTASNEIEVTSEDEVLITNRKIPTSIYTVSFVLVLLLPLLSFINNNYYTVNISIFIYISFGILLVVIMLLAGYKLYHIENVTKRTGSDVN